MTDDLVKRLRYLSRVFRKHDVEDLTYDDYLSAQLYPDEAADRIEALTAQLESTLKDRALIIAERDRTFALMLARAEKAEADNSRLREALWAILACETPNANATVTRMVAIAKAALKGESND